MIKLGVIGLSEGNGHPYSWSAICNGYVSEPMESCGFPMIPRYLEKQKWPEARISGVEVTHVWTQDRDLSSRVAQASLIPNIVDDPVAMIGKIDALLLARDDAENHLSFATPFLEAGVPVYIDKPVALSRDALRSLYRLQKYEGQIFTCSALRYAKELALTEAQREKMGAIKHIQATTPSSWEKYSVHIIEPVLRLLGDSMTVVKSQSRTVGSHGRATLFDFDTGITADFAALGKRMACPMSIRVHGEREWCELVFSDTFSAFKAAITDFVEGVRMRTCRSPLTFNERVVCMIEMGLQR